MISVDLLLSLVMDGHTDAQASDPLDTGWLPNWEVLDAGQICLLSSSKKLGGFLPFATIEKYACAAWVSACGKDTVGP